MTVQKFLIALGCFVTSASAAAQRPTLTAWTRSFLTVDTPLVALTHVTLIDGTGAQARNNQTILVSDGRIERVGASSAVVIPAAAKVLDLTGYTVIPGL